MAEKRSQRIIITGATGLIGSKLVRCLAERGDYVIVFSRDPERARRELPEASEHIRWSASMVDGQWVEAVAEADAVINLAGAPIAARWTSEHKKAIQESRINGTRCLVEAMGRAKRAPGVLVNASAVGYYGAMVNQPVTENSPAGSDFLATLCIAWETEARRAEAFGVRVVTVRTGIVLDPNEGALAQMLTPFKFFVGGPIGSGQQPFPWIHIDDEAGIFLWALDNAEVRGPINAVAPGIVSNLQFSRALGSVLHRPSLVPVPKFALSLLFGEGAIAISGGQQVVPERTTTLGYRFTHTDVEEALRDILKD